jgi:hypothetical protein
MSLLDPAALVELTQAQLARGRRRPKKRLSSQANL